jgi:hypothetical protein
MGAGGRLPRSLSRACPPGSACKCLPALTLITDSESVGLLSSPSNASCWDASGSVGGRPTARWAHMPPALTAHVRN